jgi:hypothetical protein
MECSFMNVNEAESVPMSATLEDCAAQLTQAAYRVALRHGVEDSWLDLEIELWRALADGLKKWQQRLPRGVTQHESLDAEPQGEAGHRHVAIRRRPK